MMTHWHELSTLMNRVASGDDAAFGAIGETVQDDLFRFGLAHGLNRADAAETVQEVLLRAYRGRKAWVKDTDAAAWLYRIAMNVVREFQRSRRRHTAESLGLASDLPAAESDGDPIAEYAEQLMAAIHCLPPRQREAVVCRHLQNMSVGETAEVMGCAEGTVKAAASAGLAYLRKKLRKEP